MHAHTHECACMHAWRPLAMCHVGACSQRCTRRPMQPGHSSAGSSMRYGCIAALLASSCLPLPLPPSPHPTRLAPLPCRLQRAPRGRSWPAAVCATAWWRWTCRTTPTCMQRASPTAAASYCSNPSACAACRSSRQVRVVSAWAEHARLPPSPPNLQWPRVCAGPLPPLHFSTHRPFIRT